MDEPTIYRDADIDATCLRDKCVAIVGYGNQGRAQALNLRDSGVQVVVGLRDNSTQRQVAQADRLEVVDIAASVRRADVVMLLVPDEVMGELYEQAIRPYLKPMTALGFAHGFAVHYRMLVPPSRTFMIAPKGTGEALRKHYLEGTGLPAYVAVYRDGNDDMLALALAYAQAIGCSRRGIFRTTFKEETESDLFSEQAVLCGALGLLLRQAFEVLVEAGYDPKLAYFECVSEAKLVCDLLVQEGFAAFGEKISNTAELGGYRACEKIIKQQEVKANMRRVLQDIQSGEFAREFIADYKNNFRALNNYRQTIQDHPIDKAGEDVRQLTQPICNN